MRKIVCTIAIFFLAYNTNAQWINSGVPENLLSSSVSDEYRSDLYSEPGNSNLHAVVYGNRLSWERNTGGPFSRGTVLLPLTATNPDVAIRDMNTIHVVYELGLDVCEVDYTWGSSSFNPGIVRTIANYMQPAIDNYANDENYVLALKRRTGDQPIIMQVRNGVSHALVSSVNISGTTLNCNNPDVSVQGQAGSSYFATVAYYNGMIQKITYSQYEISTSGALTFIRGGNDSYTSGPRSRPKIASDNALGKGFAYTFAIDNKIYAEGYDAASNSFYNRELTSGMTFTPPLQNGFPVVTFSPNEILFCWNSVYSISNLTGCPFITPRTGILAYSLNINGGFIPGEVYHQVETNSGETKYPTVASNRLNNKVGFAYRDFANTFSKISTISLPNYKTTNPLHNSTVQQNNMNIFPNPATSSFKISGVNEHAYEIHIMDMQGKTIFNTKGNLNEINLNLTNMSTLKKGAYLIKINDLTSQEIKTERLIKE